LLQRTGSTTYFSPPDGLLFFASNAGRMGTEGAFPMTLVSRLSVLTAYAAFAFVGAIVLGVF
jgi:hypothetical protein